MSTSVTKLSEKDCKEISGGWSMQPAINTIESIPYCISPLDSFNKDSGWIGSGPGGQNIDL